MADVSHTPFDDVPGAMRGPEAERATKIRRIGLAAIASCVVAAAFAAASSGTVTSGTSASAALRLEVEHPRILLAGTPFPFTIEVANAEPGANVEIDMCRSVVDRLDFQNWYPAPSDEASAGASVRYTFAADDTGSVTASLDARSQPNQRARQIDCTITARSGAAEAESTFSLLIAP